MTDIRDAEPQPPDDSGGYCCVSAGMHMGHDEDCKGYVEHESWCKVYSDIYEPCNCGKGKPHDA